jgi:hypothetical protein
VPRLFASQPDEARTALQSDPAKAFKDLQRIHSRLFIAENIPATEAWSFVGNPRQGNVAISAQIYLHQPFILFSVSTMGSKVMVLI